MRKNLYQLSLLFLFISFTISSKASDVRPLEWVDGITNITLTFTPNNGGDAVTATAEDPDGAGPQPLQVTSGATLLESTDYTLTILIEDRNSGTNLSQEITQNSEDYQFFFAWAEGLFANPAGNGNIDNEDDPVNYNDQDGNNLPVGLSTSWTTACVEGNLTDTFRIVLNNFPGTKSATSTINDGTVDFDLTWNITIEDDPNAPPCENEEEIITDVTLTFTPVNGGEVVTAIAQDPDGEGPLDLQILGPIDLQESTEYTMSITLENAIANEDITEEIMEEDDEHMFFFSWTDEVFTSPAGDGNIDNRADAVNYNDFDENNLPVGLSTSWTTECVEMMTAGKFRLILKHQPGIKSETSTVDDGGTDLDLEWDINVIDDPNAPPCENEEEIITDVTLTFTPVNGGEVVTAIAQDPDGEGPLDLQILGPIDLQESTEYTMSITLENAIADEDITEEIMEEDDEHMFFFSWTDEVFTSPAGDGNIDNRADAVNYNDFDENNLPVGLSTSWTTAEAGLSGNFRLVLKHQPDTKSETSTVEDGGTDLDLEWTINVVMSTSVRDQAVRNQALRLSPNPTTGQLYWTVENENLDEVELRIFDQMGRVVKVWRTQDNAVDVTELAQGMFTLQVVSGGKIWVKRFIKR